MRQIFRHWHIKEKLVKAIDSDYNNIQKNVSDQKIYAVSLVTDSDTVSLYLAVNTFEYLEKKNKNLQELFSKSNLESKDVFYNTKWIPAEWGYSNNKLEESEISKIVPILFEKSMSFEDDGEFDEYQIIFFEMMNVNY